ncbi:hypothetical protein HMSSN139_62590 [Paenibacillus sp. HMSSN-139]|nr:hypothetical protein HMSSN139_62590 [Paenibacillus sp. HMSSN-139]
MTNVYLNWFTRDEQFPFFIQYGGHEEDTFDHSHADFSELVIVLNGHATHIVNNEESFIKKGNVFVINGSTSHAYKDPQDLKSAISCIGRKCWILPDTTCGRLTGFKRSSFLSRFIAISTSTRAN